MTTLGPLLTSKMIFLALKFWPLLLVPECRKGLQKGAKKETSPCRKFFYQLVSTYTDCALVKRVIEEKLEVSSKESVKKILIFCHLFKKRESMVFCYQNCSDLLWEKIVLESVQQRQVLLNAFASFFRWCFTQCFTFSVCTEL